MTNTSIFWWIDAVGTLYTAAFCALVSTSTPETPMQAYLFGAAFYSAVWTLLMWISEATMKAPQ